MCTNLLWIFKFKIKRKLDLVYFYHTFYTKTCKIIILYCVPFWISFLKYRDKLFLTVNFRHSQHWSLSLFDVNKFDNFRIKVIIMQQLFASWFIVKFFMNSAISSSLVGEVDIISFLMENLGKQDWFLLNWIHHLVSQIWSDAYLPTPLKNKKKIL